MNEHDEQNVEICNLSSDVVSEDVVNILKNIFDPEIFYSIYDIGLIYKINIDSKNIKITMTLTSVNCPEAQSIPDEVFNKIQEQFPEHTIEVELVFDPAWTVENMSDEIKLKLGLL